jgi:hypothetical protein
MKFFELVRSVLDELYDEVPGNSEAERDALVLEKLDYLHRQYANCWKGVNIDYGDPAVRFAYVHCYTTSHASFVAQLISGTPELRKLFNRTEVEMSALGGGPGTELLGALKHCMAKGRQLALRCNLFDRQLAWAEAWADVDVKIKASFTVSTRFLQMDVTLTCPPKTGPAEMRVLRDIKAQGGRKDEEEPVQ